MKKFLMTAAAVVFGIAASVAHAEDTVKIGTAGPMTGQYASFGKQMKNGAEMAVKDINEAGGVLGKKVELKVYDDACDPKQAVAVANKAVGDGVVFMAGHFCSGSSIPASKVYEEEGIVMISPASTNPKLTDEGGPNVFRVCGRDDQQGKTAAEFIAKEFPNARVAIFHDKTAYGKGLADEMRKRFHELGKKEILYGAYTAGEKDYSALVSKLKKNKIDLLYLGGYHTEAGLIVRQMRDQGMKTRLMSGDALVTQEYWAITGPAGEGTLMTFSPDPRKSPAAAEVVKKFEAAGINPEGYVLYTYAAIQAWKQAAEQAKSVDPAKVTEALHKGKFKTVLGELSFDEKGDVTLPGYVVYIWHDGKYMYYDEYKKQMEKK
ncbi:branched-chain amino acid ABC transporter substrate-binding protein [Thermopetrobacter sp. TC1]|uniref:branched-chain amino acid ABC transporter substrate-binding protein n=1 Tax=Thermopetrobacter sp. TC1 TaxID=1495045 RepID=UPI00068D763A|nr:branched-chain amino acid ABC transporter substrate-binding protein [Thermopetrobacter sp. TC1]